MKIGKTFVLALVLATMGAGVASATTVGGGGGVGEEYNGFVPLPPASWSDGATSFTMVFAGDVVSSIDTSATQNNTLLNPFYYVNQNYFGGSGTTSVTASFDGTNTDVTFTGSNPILSTYTFNYGSGPHFGVGSTTGGQWLNIVSQTWSDGSGDTVTLPAVSASLVTVAPAGDPYAIVFAEVTSSGNTVGQWFELPYTGPIPSVTLTNYTSSSETLSDVGYFLSPTQIPLDQLNYGTTPPPGTAGSPFTPLPSLDGTSLSGSGGSVTVTGLPEPSGVLSLGTGLLVVAGCLGRRLRAARAGRTGRIA